MSPHRRGENNKPEKRPQEHDERFCREVSALVNILNVKNREASYLLKEF